KVYRVAIAYIVAGWALAQGLAQVLPVFDISNSVIRVVIALLLIGFPVALVLAWVFDVTSEGIKATPSVASGGHRRRNVLMLAAAGVVISIAAGFFVLPRAAAHKIDKSIAVLPFENLSDEKENAYFADGIQDDILTNLSKIGDLKVISRTSVMSYRGSGARNAREIGKALGVATLLEGSVRRIGNRVRVNVQLINADNDEHIWAEDYDRDLTDVFAGLSMVESWMYHTFDPTAQRRDKARDAANEALRLQPDLPEAHLALGFSYYYGDRDYGRALAEFEIAKRGLPNEAQAYMAIGAIQRRQGRWVESTANLEKAAALDPKNGSVLLNLAYNYMATRNFEAADKTFDRGIEVAPESFGSRALKGELAIRWKGDIS